MHFVVELKISHHKRGEDGDFSWYEGFTGTIEQAEVYTIQKLREGDVTDISVVCIWLIHKGACAKLEVRPEYWKKL